MVLILELKSGDLNSDTETGIDIERSDEIYFVCKDDLGQLRGALDQTGVVKSRHYPMGYEGIGIDFKPGRLG